MQANILSVYLVEDQALLRESFRARRESESDVEVIGKAASAEQAILLTQPRWRDQAQTRGVKIEMQTDLQAIPRVAGIAPDIRHVITNLIFNATDASQKTGR